MAIISNEALDVLFRQARSQNKWLDEPVSQAELREIHDIVKWGPTSANGQHQRIVFCISDESKEKLASIAMEGNKNKILTAPVVAILAYDTRFFELLPELFPHNPGMADVFRDNEKLAETTAFRNATLQGGYFMLAARAIGLDCSPMSGFDNQKCDQLFFPDGRCKSNFLCGIGHGDPEGLFDRLPRPDFDQVCTIV